MLSLIHPDMVLLVFIVYISQYLPVQVSDHGKRRKWLAFFFKSEQEGADVFDGIRTISFFFLVC